MNTFTITTYKYNELSPEAQAKARDWYREGKTEHFAWADEALASLKALAEHFGGKLANYSIDFTGDYPPSFAKFDMPDMEGDTIGYKLASLGDYNPETLKGHGDCKLTGYCADESAIDGFRIAYVQGERDLDKLMQAAFQSWLSDCQADCKHENGDEAIAETIEANEYDFTAEGKRTVVLS